MLKFLFVLVLLVFAVIGAGVVALVVLGDENADSNDGATTGGVARPVSATAGPAAPVDTDLTAAELLQQATEAAAKVTSFHFVLRHENGSTPLPLNLGLESAEGDILVPASMRAEVDADAFGINVSVEVIGIEDQTWITNPFTRDWQRLPNTNIRDFADPAALVSGLLPSITDAQLSDGGKVDGVETLFVSGSIDSGALRDALGIAEPGRSVQVEAWMGVDDLLPRRVRLTGALSDGESSNVVREIELSRYDEPVEIMPPE